MSQFSIASTLACPPFLPGFTQKPPQLPEAAQPVEWPAEGTWSPLGRWRWWSSAPVPTEKEVEREVRPCCWRGSLWRCPRGTWRPGWARGTDWPCRTCGSWGAHSRSWGSRPLVPPWRSLAYGSSELLSCQTETNTIEMMSSICYLAVM